MSAAQSEKHTLRVMVDTNVLLSAMLFPGKRMIVLFEKIITKYQLVLSSFVVDELREVTHRKFTGKEEVVDVLLSQLPYELVYTPKQPEPGLFRIRDEKDYPVLYSALTEDIDIFITGDRDFNGLSLKGPEIISPAEFLEKY